MNITRTKLKEHLEEAKQDGLLNVVDAYKEPEEKLMICCKLLLGRTDIEHLKLSSLKEAVQKAKIDFSKDQEIQNFLGKTEKAIQEYQKVLWDKKEPEGKEIVTYQSFQETDTIETDISKNLQAFSEQVVQEEQKKKNTTNVLEQLKQDCVKKAKFLARELTDFESLLQNQVINQENLTSREFSKTYRQLEEKFTRCKLRKAGLMKDYDKIMERIKALKMDSTTFEKDVQKYLTTIEEKWPKVEQLLNKLSIQRNAKKKDTAKKTEKRIARNKKALQEALNLYELQKDIIEKKIKEIENLLTIKSAEKDPNIIALNAQLESVFNKLEARINTIADQLAIVIKYYQKLGINTLRFEKEEKAIIEKYQKIYAVLHEDYTKEQPARKNSEDQEQPRKEQRESEGKKYDQRYQAIVKECDSLLEQLTKQEEYLQTKKLDLSKAINEYQSTNKSFENLTKKLETLKQEYNNFEQSVKPKEETLDFTRIDQKVTIYQSKNEELKKMLKNKLSKYLGEYGDALEKANNDLEDFQKELKNHQEKKNTYTPEELTEVKKRIQNKYSKWKTFVQGFDKSYQVLLKGFTALQLDTEEFEKSNMEATASIKKKWQEIETECANFGIDIQKQMNSEEPEKHVTSFQLKNKKLTLIAAIKRLDADLWDLQSTMFYYQEPMRFYSEEKTERIKEKLQNLYNQCQLERIAIERKYQEVLEGYKEKDWEVKNIETKYNERIKELNKQLRVTQKQCTDLGLNPTPDLKTEDEKREEKKKELASVKAYLKSLKQLAPWALGGASVGLGASIVVPSVGLTGLGSIRLAYSLAKFGNTIVSKGFLNGEPTPIDNVVDIAKSTLKNAANYTVGEKRWYRRIREGVRNINKFLRNPKVQSVINGFSFGYVVGNLLNLDDKFDKLFQNSQSGPSGGAITSGPRKEIETQVRKVLEQNPMPENPPKVPSYDWIETGVKIDLTGIQEGFTNVYDAMANNNAVSLMSELATGENGTFIEQFVLPNGEKFLGNMDALMAKCDELGVQLENVGALISNQNGYYAYTTAEAVMEHALELGKSL